ncbi:ribonuclease HII [Flavobacteriales bacterium 34_180_T64]|nr:ribonuclease HII [Flavobacteriales bacterium 34_180_T64]
MKHLLFILVCLTILISCENDSKLTTNPFHLIPENSSVVLIANNIESIQNSFKSNGVLQELAKYSQIENLNYQLKNLKYINADSEILVCLTKDKNDSIEFSLITKHSKSVFNLDSIPNHTIETFTSNSKSIHKITIEDQFIYTSINDSLFFASNRRATVEASFGKKLNNKEIEKIYKQSNSKASITLLIKTHPNQFEPLLFDNAVLNDMQFTNHYVLETDISQDEIVFNGITKAVDSTKSILNIFKNTIAQETLISNICPQDIEHAMSFTFDDFNIFNSQLSKFNKKDSTYSASPIFDNITEAGLLSKNDNHAVFLNSIDAMSTIDAIAPKSLIETFRDVDINSFESPALFNDTFSPLIQFNTASKYFNLGNYFVFADDIEFLKAIISNIQNGSVLQESDAYQNMMLDLSDASSLFIYANASRLNRIFNTNFSEEKNLKLKAYKASAIQFIYETDFAHVHSIIKKHKARAANNSVSEELNITLESDLLIAPQVVSNHITNQKDIAIQDINNNLYLYSNRGKIHWKKQLNGKILGHIEQIDMYKNGRLQLVFATQNRVYVLDRNGKDVTPFPLKFNDKITQPLSVFDYDKKKNYRLLVTQGKNMLMYDIKGKIVKGFRFKSAEYTISSQPKHFRIGRKDFIVFANGTNLEILDRIGKTRIDVKDEINFSGNDIYLYKNKFSTTDKDGRFIQVNAKGQTSSSVLNLKDNHHIATTSKTFVSLSDNRLTIKSKTIELDYGEYTAPKIFYLNDKIYISVTDLQAKKVYLFDSQAKTIPNFPVYGNSIIELNNIDKDTNLEVVTKGDHNSIIIYQIN